VLRVCEDVPEEGRQPCDPPEEYERGAAELDEPLRDGEEE